LDRLARQGQLGRFRYVHLATHGFGDPAEGLRSHLLLSQERLPDPPAAVHAGQEVYDGKLTAEQILRTWKLNAEVVTLSACETALGQQQGGEGYLGFAQALFLAGARTLVLSLWQVDDRATALLMTRFYQNLLGRRPGLDQPLSKGEALAEAKHWLRTLPAPERDRLLEQLPGSTRGTPAALEPQAEGLLPYEHPYYWAAFILVGDPGTAGEVLLAAPPAPAEGPAPLLHLIGPWLVVALLLLAAGGVWVALRLRRRGAGVSSP
jgi:CHAT domain-containing protein